MKINHGSALIYSCINVSTIHDKDMHQVRFFDKDITLGVQAYYKDESITLLLGVFKWSYTYFDSFFALRLAYTLTKRKLYIPLNQSTINFLF